MDDRLTVPMYEAAHAARLLGLHPARVRRWLFGYDYSYAASKRTQKPLVRRGAEQARLASFIDLMELLFAKSFLEKGISVQRMRRALAEAQELVGVDHPFARRKFFSSGREIFLEVQASPGGGKQLMHLLHGGQWAFHELIVQHAKQIEFAATGEAKRWWPLGKGIPVVLDPGVSFGQPAIAGRGLRTDVLYDMWTAEGHKVSRVASWFRINENDVKAAVRFEVEQRRAA